MATAAVLFEDGQLKAKAGHFDETSFWLLGPQGKKVFDDLPAAQTRTHGRRFDEGGYYVLDLETPISIKLLFDCGPLGFGRLAAHGHADALSFVMTVRGRPLFIDPGTYIYEAGNPFRDYFRSTAAHNTLTVDGMDQSEMAGPFLWSRRANARLEDYLDDERHFRVTASHDGYRRLGDPVTHRRTLDYDKQRCELTIIDRIEALAEHDLCQYFHLAPEWQMTRLADNHWAASKADEAIHLFTDSKVSSRVVRGQTRPICGWASRQYDEKIPIDTLVCSGRTQGSTTLTTKLVLRPDPLRTEGG